MWSSCGDQMKIPALRRPGSCSRQRAARQVTGQSVRLTAATGYRQNLVAAYRHDGTPTRLSVRYLSADPGRVPQGTTGRSGVCPDEQARVRGCSFGSVPAVGGWGPTALVDGGGWAHPCCEVVDVVVVIGCGGCSAAPGWPAGGCCLDAWQRGPGPVWAGRCGCRIEVGPGLAGGRSWGLAGADHDRPRQYWLGG